MRRLYVVSALICGLMSLTMPTAWANSPDVIRVEGLRGTSSIRASVQGDWQGLSGSADVSAGATLRTGSGAEALMTLPGDVVLRVAPGSQVEVTRVDGHELGLRLQSGRVYANVPAEASAPAHLQIQTPSGLAESRGGEFTVVAAESTSVRVVSGNARLSGQRVGYAGLGAGSSQALELPSGVEAVAQNNGDDQDEGGADDEAGTGDQGTGGQGTGGQGTGGSGTGGAGVGGGTGGAGGTFPWIAVLGAAGVLGLIAILVSQASEAQSN